MFGPHLKIGDATACDFCLKIPCARAMNAAPVASYDGIASLRWRFVAEVRNLMRYATSRSTLRN